LANDSFHTVHPLLRFEGILGWNPYTPPSELGVLPSQPHYLPTLTKPFKVTFLLDSSELPAVIFEPILADY
jgi:hypothetical protein